MYIDVILAIDQLDDVAATAQAAEATGFDALWTSETAHDPFLPLALAAEHTQRIQLGTAIAVAFARSPMTVAYTAWDLQALSGGRFVLGLGTQVKAHIERRFGMMWAAPAPRLREYIQALRAIWDCWQNSTRLNFRGEFYKLTLMTDFFNPGPIEHPHIPIFIAGVNRYLCQLAGELCDGFHVHPFHSARYLQEFILPNIETGLRRAGRTRSDIQLASSIFVITGQDETEVIATRAAVRRQIAFYASTPSYRPVLETHGWGDVGEQLSRLAARKRWSEMPALITDEMLDVFAVSGSLEEIPARIQNRYDGLLDRISYYRPFRPGRDLFDWQATVAAFQG
ncbi:MAG TPA: LLM class F420-dependent oxidoreductase [Anaerolineae bacterium]|nr:LLM class F420-dependent oxidoreductase [Anaerolineae bacterium]HIQ04139.1 LLM class F420-dependent oxidoreductase [Anaerolineae bacterium]